MNQTDIINITDRVPEWKQISLMYILKIIYINNKECAHYGLYSHFMDLTGLVSVCTNLNFIVMYTWNIAEILPNWDLNIN